MPEQQRNGFCKVEASHRLRYLGHRSSYGGVSHGGDAGLVVGFRRCKPNRLPICVLIGNAEKRWVGCETASYGLVRERTPLWWQAITVFKKIPEISHWSCFSFSENLSWTQLSFQCILDHTQHSSPFPLFSPPLYKCPATQLKKGFGIEENERFIKKIQNPSTAKPNHLKPCAITSTMTCGQPTKMSAETTNINHNPQIFSYTTGWNPSHYQSTLAPNTSSTSDLYHWSTNCKHR